MRSTMTFVIACSVLLATTDTQAVVVQIDGTVVPLGLTGTCPVEHVRCCLAVHDPGGVIDPVLDARVYPGIFEIPCPTGCDRSECGVVAGCEFYDVHFEVLGEGAGYHNSFGWYNVGDDVTAVANLHNVLGCRPESGAIICPDSTPRTADIDFQAEFELGNYDGGFIGMWLRTPERLAGGSDPDGCGAVGTRRARRGAVGTMARAARQRRGRRGNGRDARRALPTAALTPRCRRGVRTSGFSEF